MKFAAAYYLLLIYTTVIINPLIPLAEDGLSHFFAEAYHVATVHAMFGNDHLEKQEAAANNNNPKSTSKEESSVQVHIAEMAPSCFLNIPRIFKIYFIQAKAGIVNIFHSITIPPPKFFF